MNKPYYWWYVYGHFAPGEDNLPCLGEVINYYFVLSGLSKDEFAVALHCTGRYIEMIKSPKNKNMPNLLSRRILLAKVLHIPPVLLGLSSVTLFEWGTGDAALVKDIGLDTVASTGTMTSYERLLALCWELYYTSSVGKARDNIDEAFQKLSVDFADATGIKRDQFDAMRCRFYQLYSLISRDSNDTKSAIDYQNKAVEIAFRLKNAELIASSLLRRARAYHHIPERELALKDALDALPYADLSRDPLKGKCYQMAGESQSYLAGDNKDLQEKSLAYFNKAAQIARKGNLEPDGSFVKTDLTSIYIEKAEALVLFKRFDEAHNALSIARKNLSPEITRWQVNLLLAEASTYFAEGDISSCCYSIEQVLPLIRVLNLPSKEQRVVSLYASCKNIAPDNKVVLSLAKIV
jgi:hypothetical protein